jgi:hypothetical protein
VTGRANDALERAMLPARDLGRSNFARDPPITSVMSDRRRWWIGQCAMMASLSYAAGFAPMGDAHYVDLLAALVDEQAHVIWSGPPPARVSRAHSFQ